MSLDYSRYKQWLLDSVNLPGTLQDRDNSKLIDLSVRERELMGGEPGGEVWNETRALAKLGITKRPFNLDRTSEVHGYSDTKSIAITRDTAFPSRVVWHELGHVLCEHTARMKPGNPVAECEAELVAYILCNIYDYNEAKRESRGYIQHWRDVPHGGGTVLKSVSIPHIYQAVNKIREASK
jgi:hypothetical protein